MVVHKDGCVIAAGNDGCVTFGVSGDCKTEQVSGQWIEVMSFNPEGTMLAIGSHDNCIYIYSFAEEGCELKCTL